MPSFRTTRRVRHTPEEMFDLVADVEKYPLFLPLCEGLRVRSRVPGEGGRETLIADMSVGYKAIHETFTSKVTLDRATLKIMVAYLDGPFRALDNLWSFKPDGRGLPRRVLHLLRVQEPHARHADGGDVRPRLSQIPAAFEKRAEVVYGRRPGA